MGWTIAFYVFFALAFAAVAAAAFWAHLRYWVARLTLPLQYSEEEVLSTADGARIEIRRLPRLNEAPELPPVLLVHGIAANHRNQDIHPDYSLARHLAALGRDVWLLTLRSGRLLNRVERRSVHFAAMARFDLPCAIEAVLQRSGSPRLDYVGFSMGGMLLYAALARSVPEARIRRVVIVGSPGRIGPPSRLARFLPRRLLPGAPLRMLARSVAFASEWLPTPVHHAFANPLNMPPGVTRLTLVNCIEDIPATLGADFFAWATGDGEIRIDGERVLDGLASVSAPALFIAGSADRVAPVSAVRVAFEAWGCARPETPKQFVVIGRDFGANADYGHGDLALGLHVGADLFKPIALFLGPEEEAPRAQGAEALHPTPLRRSTPGAADLPLGPASS